MRLQTSAIPHPLALRTQLTAVQRVKLIAQCTNHGMCAFLPFSPFLGPRLHLLFQARGEGMVIREVNEQDTSD
jgi:hypothetical protein